MATLLAGLILALLFHAFIVLLLVAVVVLFPKSFLGEPARAALNWLPPFLGGQALRDWAAKAAEQLARERLAGRRNSEPASRLVTEMHQAAMQAMLPLAETADLERIVACPESGQGRVGVTAPEALAIAAHIRKHKSRTEQQRIQQLASENAKKIAALPPGDCTCCPCALQGTGHVCCVFSQRPLRCRPLHATSISNDMGRAGVPSGCPATQAADKPGHAELVTEGFEAGLRRALDSAGLDAQLYELNSAVATALEIPDAAERWARGDVVFQKPLR